MQGKAGDLKFLGMFGRLATMRVWSRIGQYHVYHMFKRVCKAFFISNLPPTITDLNAAF
jgi:hypothetical protein